MMITDKKWIKNRLLLYRYVHLEVSIQILVSRHNFDLCTRRFIKCQTARN